jgi:nitroimidazol reductase NimA-like FMN-containing flavoprotein (pyridoxamine 5'-phosphate oxidase superfamily)
MRRRDRRLSDETTLALLREGEWGVLCLAGENAYGVPVNYVLDDAGGAKWPDIFFHCALEGKKLEYIRENPAVCLCVVRKAETLREEFSTDYASVTVMARAETVGDEQERLRILRLFGRRFTPFSLGQIDAYIARHNARVCLVRLRPLEASGKARTANAYDA